MSILRRSTLPIITASTLLLSGCSSIGVDDYAERSPKLIPQEFFNGKLCADGLYPTLWRAR